MQLQSLRAAHSSPNGRHRSLAQRQLSKMASTSALTTTAARDDANAAAAKATIDLLRVADMDDETKDASVAAVDACGRLARALAVPGAVRPRDAPAALLPATMLLLRPPRGRRRRAAIESAAGCASAAITACGPALARVAGVDGVSRLLGGVSLRLADNNDEGITSKEEATLALLRAARSAFTSSQTATGNDRKAWLVVWDRLNGQESDGRVLVAGLAHATALLVKGGASREARLNAVELLDAMVAATPQSSNGTCGAASCPVYLGLCGRRPRRLPRRRRATRCVVVR